MFCYNSPLIIVHPILGVKQATQMKIKCSFNVLYLHPLQMAYILTTLTLLSLTSVLIYGYTAIPNAGDAVNRLLSSKGTEKTEQKEPEIEETPETFMNRVVNYKLGHPGVGDYTLYTGAMICVQQIIQRQCFMFCSIYRLKDILAVVGVTTVILFISFYFLNIKTQTD